LGGQKRFAIRLWLDSQKMAARQVTVLDVERALHEQNVELPSGRVENLQREMTIQVRGEMKTPEEFDRLVIKESGGALVRLADIGKAEVGVEDERSVARFNSKPAVGLGVVKQSKANTIEVARGIKAELERIKPLLPAEVQTSIPYDESIYVERSITEVWETLGIAFVLVVLTIFVFLRDVRSTLIPTITIPVSIIATFAILSVMGYSINILTMLALVLTIGIVVDDSIVVLENIYRHIEEGMAPMDAAFKAMREIAFAVITITVALVAVFLPLAFQTSITGRLLIEFAFALAGSVVISAFVALSLTPMISARILKPIHKVKHGKLFETFERGFDRISNRYRRILEWSLQHRITIGIIGLASLLLSFVFLMLLDKEDLPEEDKGRLFSIVICPEGSTSEYTDRMVQKLEGFAAKTPEVEGYFSAVALARGAPGKASEGLMFVRLEEKRDRHVRDIVGGPNGFGANFFMNVEGAIAFPIIPKAVMRGFGQSFQVVLQHPDLNVLNAKAEEIATKLRSAGFLMNVRSTFELAKPELRVAIDRNRAAMMGVSIQDISRSLQILFGGQDLSHIKRDGKEYDVIVQLDRLSRLTPQNLENVYVQSKSGQLIQLSNLVSYETGAGPNSIQHYNRHRSATIEGTPMGVPLGTVVKRTTELLDQELTSDFQYEWAGEAKSMQDSDLETLFVLILAVIIVYMVLAAQFESLIHPITVIVSLFLAAFGALGALWLMQQVNLLGTMLHGWANYAPNPPGIVKFLSGCIPRISGMTINLFSKVGLVLLLGLVTKNAILLVEFANQQMALGKSAKQAMLQAGMIRLRPILMTSVSTIAGILPIAIGFGAGAESRRPLGVVVVGGLLTSTVLTLVVIPVIYTWFSEFSSWVQGSKSKTFKAPTPQKKEKEKELVLQ
jgi:multidrug efflux pump